jgi:hypothetical protein
VLSNELVLLNRGAHLTAIYLWVNTYLKLDFKGFSKKHLKIKVLADRREACP